MALEDCQVQVGSLVMSMDPGATNFTVLDDFNPWTRNVRADQTQPRAWGNGSWSGAEWADQVTIPMRIRVRNLADGTPGGWLAAHQLLSAAFSPASDDVELRWVTGGVEYMMRGRPRVVEPDTTTIRRGYSISRCAFVALDPLVYSAEEHSETLVLPATSGGLTVPLTLPVTVGAAVVAGRRPITNIGTATAGLRLRIDGPVIGPRVSLLTPDGSTATLRFDLTLVAGQWLDVDTGGRTVYLNGTASRRGKTSGDWPVLPPGVSEISFDAASYDSLATAAVAWRDAWN